MNVLTLAENGFIPYFLLRLGIRQRLKRKLELEADRSPDEVERFKTTLRASSIAEKTDKANEQHYELPTEFYKHVLGPYMKYSSGFWPENCATLEASELSSLELVAKRAQLRDGQRILELGCGWGSFSLWAAERYPNSELTSVSNSASQAKYIYGEAKKRNIENLRVLVGDINKFNAIERHDRIVSIEMFEHVRNHEALFKKLSGWLEPDGRLFVHVFSHKKHAYAYDENNPSEWMAKHFFTGGIMPSHDLLPSYDKHLKLQQSWKLDGTHYQKTSEAWLANLNRNEHLIRPIFESIYGPQHAKQWLWRWRLFFLACAELFGYKDGSEWGVSHYRFEKASQI